MPALLLNFFWGVGILSMFLSLKSETKALLSLLWCWLPYSFALMCVCVDNCGSGTVQLTAEEPSRLKGGLLNSRLFSNAVSVGVSWLGPPRSIPGWMLKACLYLLPLLLQTAAVGTWGGDVLVAGLGVLAVPGKSGGCVCVWLPAATVCSGKKPWRHPCLWLLSLNIIVFAMHPCCWVHSLFHFIAM